MPSAAAPASDDEPPSSGSFVPHIFAGVAGRVAAETFKSPFDLLKVRVQYDTSLRGASLPVQLYTVLREDGMQAWRGLPPRLIWSAPLAGATFTYYQVLKTETGGSSEGKAGFSMKTVLGGPAVLAFSVAVRTPFDIIEQQLQLSAANAGNAGVQSGEAGAAAAEATAAAGGQPLPEPFTPTPAAMRQRILETWKIEGVRGVWRGYPAAFCGITTYVAGYFVIYEAARRALEQVAADLVKEHPTVSHLLAGGLGGGLTAMLATPFDCIKVRMQTKIYVTAADPFPSMPHVWRETVKVGGWQALWRGATARFTSNAPSGAIMFATYEAGWRWLDKKLLTLTGGRGEM